jgi:hypothetical protein
MGNRIPLEIVLLSSRRTPLHRTKALSSSESTVSNPCTAIRAFSGQSSALAAGRRLFQLARLVETLLCHGTDAESRGASKGPVHANLDLPRPQALGASPMSERLTRKARVTSSLHSEHRDFNSPWTPQNLSNSEILCWQRAPFWLSHTRRLQPSEH